MKRLKWFILWVMIALWFASVFALSYSWTSFSKNNKPITLPPTQFCSWTSLSGTEAIGGTCYLKVGESWANYSLVPLYDMSGNIYITGWALAWFLTGWVITTSVTEPWVDTLVPSEQALVEYFSWYAYDIGDAIVSGHYYITWGAVFGRIGISGTQVSLQTYTWWNRVEQSYISNSEKATSFTYPWSNSYIPTTKAVADYLEASAQNLGDVITTWAYVLSGAVKRQITLSWSNLSFQLYTGWAWVEKWNFTP